MFRPFLVLLEFSGKTTIVKVIWVRKSCIFHKAGNYSYSLKM